MTYAGYIEMDAFCTDLLHDCLYGTDYIAHANRNGKERKNHKYSFRKWAGDHWEYIYDKMTKGSERRQHQANISSLQSMNNANARLSSSRSIDRYNATNNDNLARIKEEQAAIDKIDNMPINRLIRAGKATIDMGKKVLDAIIGGVKSAATAIGNKVKNAKDNVEKKIKSYKKTAKTINDIASMAKDHPEAAKTIAKVIAKTDPETVKNVIDTGTEINKKYKEASSTMNKYIGNLSDTLGINKKNTKK